MPATQFENHVCAVAEQPIGSIEPLGCNAIVNVFGRAPSTADMLHLGPRVHLYSKEPKPGRKIGHATLVAPSIAALVEPLQRLQALTMAASFQDEITPR